MYCAGGYHYAGRGGGAPGDAGPVLQRGAAGAGPHRDAEQPPVPEPEHLHHRGDHVSPAQGPAAPGHPGARGAGERGIVL